MYDYAKISSILKMIFKIDSFWSVLRYIFVNEQNKMEEQSKDITNPRSDHGAIDSSGTEALKTQDDESITKEEDLIATQGIFAHTTSLEDSITDEVGVLDIQESSKEDDESGRGSIMRSSIHELQGDDAIVQLTGDSKQVSSEARVESDER